MEKKYVQGKGCGKKFTSIKLPQIGNTKDNNVKTIMDVDPNFYSLVEGRPIRPDTSIRKYKQNIKDIALKRTLYGFIMDEILRIDRDVKKEGKIFETASKHFQECQESFDKFLADDNNKTIIIMRKSDILAKTLANELENYKKIHYELASLRSKLQYIDETLQILVSFKNFLYKAAPILWQDSHKSDLVTNSLGFFTMEADLFCSINVKLIEDKLNRLPPVQLYFETPDQILLIFELLEKQNLNYLLQTEELRTEKNNFLKSLGLLKILLRHELNYIQEKIHEVEVAIAHNEIREAEIKQEFYTILEDKIHFLLSSEMALKIYNYVEFTYEYLIAPNDTKLNSLNMVLALEQEYNNIMLDLSTFDLDVINSIEKKIYEDGTEEIKEAKEAAKLLKAVEKLSKRLKSSYEPPRRERKY